MKCYQGVYMDERGRLYVYNVARAYRKKLSRVLGLTCLGRL